jgi:hypothetical protein
VGQVKRTRDVNRAFPWLRNWLIWHDFDSSLGIAFKLRETIKEEKGLVTQSEADYIISASAENPPNLELGLLVPFIPLDERIEEFAFSVRSYNCLKREGHHSFSDLQGLTPDDLREVRNLGGNSLNEILAKLFTLNLEYSDQPVTRMTRTRMNFFGESADPLSDDESEDASTDGLTNVELASLENMGNWLSVSGPIGAFELLRLDSDLIDSLSLSALEQDIDSVRKLISKNQLGKVGIFETFRRASKSHISLIQRRICCKNPETLQKLADEVSVSRERMRQIENALRDEYLNLVKASPQCHYLAECVKKSAAQMMSIEKLRSDFPNLVTYEELGGLSDLDLVIGFEEKVFLVNSLLSIYPEQKLVELVQAVALSNPDVGLLNQSDFLSALSELGDSETLYEFGIRKGLFTLKNGLIYPSRMSLGDLTELVLGAAGSPLDYDELTDLVLVTKSPKSFRNMLFADARFVRTSLTHWGLASWGLDEYTNIRDEIAEVLEEFGEVSLVELAAELSEKYGVSPSSVSAYANAWPFQTINGKVSRTQDTSVIYTRSLAENRDLFRVRGIPVLRVRYGSEQHRGSGTPLGKAAAIVLDLEHGSKREIPMTEQRGSLNISFVSSQPNLGSVRAAAEAVQAQEGDYLLLFLGQNAEVQLLADGEELSLARVSNFFGTEPSSLDDKGLLEMMREFLLLETRDALPAVFSALRAREEFSLEADIRKKVGENEAYNMRVNLRSDSKFKIKSIDSIRKDL